MSNDNSCPSCKIGKVELNTEVKNYTSEMVNEFLNPSLLLTRPAYWAFYTFGKKMSGSKPRICKSCQTHIGHCPYCQNDFILSKFAGELTRLKCPHCEKDFYIVI